MNSNNNSFVIHSACKQRTVQSDCRCTTAVPAWLVDMDVLVLTCNLLIRSLPLCFLETVAVGAKPVYVANTYPPAVTPTRPMATAIKLIQTTPLSTANAVSYASYTYQPVATPSVVVCSHSGVARTSTVSSAISSAAGVGRIPSLISGSTDCVRVLWLLYTSLLFTLLIIIIIIILYHHMWSYRGTA